MKRNPITQGEAVYREMPLPSVGFFAFPFLLCLPFLVFLLVARSAQSLWFLLGASVLSACAMLSALNTKYCIYPAGLVLRSGFLHRTVSFASIVSIERVKFPAIHCGCLPGYWGFCNRLTDAVVLRLHDKLIYCTPRDCEQFVKLLKEGLGTRDRL